MTGIDHEHNESVVEAARWYATQPKPFVGSPVNTLRERFGLSALEACEALALSRKPDELRGAA